MQVQIEESWKQHLQQEFDSPYFGNLVAFVRREYATNQVFPPGKLIFNAFNLCPFDKVKVVIIGQDPYHDDGQAHGLCFSVPSGIKIPPSLVNIYKEIQTDIGTLVHGTGDLTGHSRECCCSTPHLLSVRIRLVRISVRDGNSLPMP